MLKSCIEFDSRKTILTVDFDKAEWYASVERGFLGMFEFLQVEVYTETCLIYLKKISAAIFVIAQVEWEHLLNDVSQ